MFYKNVIFVFPLFWYGFYSVFSGVSFYDPFIYQLFNLIFTSNPIIYYAIFDYEHPKEKFLSEPKHYSLGFKSKFVVCNFIIDLSFSKWVFWRWIIYGIWQGALVAFFCIYSMESINAINGRNSELMVDG